MNRYIAAVSVGIAFLMCLFPPWRVQIQGKGVSASVGYFFLLSTHSPLAHIDLTKLLVQLLLVAIAAGGVVLAISWNRRRNSER